MKVLLLTPPLTDLNTPYPATPHLTGFLKQQGHTVSQMDLGILLINKMLTCESLAQLFEEVEEWPERLNKRCRMILSNADFYVRNVETVKRFLQGKDNTLAHRLAQVEFWEDMYGLPELEELEWDFGAAGFADQAKLLCTLYLKNICELLQKTTHPYFELIRYAEKLCLRLPTFDKIETALSQESPTLDQWAWDILRTEIEAFSPDFIGFTVPFPGNLYTTLRLAQSIKQSFSNIPIIMGGGYVNTELRQLSDTRLFDYIDYLTFDDGELPFLRIINQEELLRCMYRKEETLVRCQMDSKENIPFKELPAPSYQGLQLDKYISFVESANPMHRLWSDGKWNKLIMAHGCYWAKCSFCDTCLDYIGRFEQAPATIIVDRMEQVMQETGISGFHFVDEAAPPALLRQVAEEILRRKLVVSYWTNIRFEKSYTPELCYLLAKSGLIAVAGGLEVASNRLLKLINKGVTIESASQAMRNLTEHGILVHTYLMYGFSTQTVKELYDSLGVVRDLFEEGCIFSAFWHQYAMTIHSTSGRDPQSVNATRLESNSAPFANNEIPFECKPMPPWSNYSEGLRLATYNYMRGTGFDIPLKNWFKH